MSHLLERTLIAREWADSKILLHSRGIYGKVVSAVIWTDARGGDGEPLVPVDPLTLVAKINSNPYILLHNHDPGRPKGQVLESAYFETDGGEKFVAAVLGYYAGGDVVGFCEFNLDINAPVPSPKALPPLPDEYWIQFATDPREVDEGWLNQVAKNDGLIRIVRAELSHNAADSAQELIRVGLIYLAVVWNPFVTSIASEAGKAAYVATHAWLRKLLERMADRRNPILDIHTHQDGCQVSFILRGKDVKGHYAAHDSLSAAAAQAAKLVAKLKSRGSGARQLIYEFDRDALLWYPSFAVLNDNKIVTDNIGLIAIEQLPNGLSLGLTRERSLFPADTSVDNESNDEA
ncbi:DUF4329 domain-containing protein [Pseudomonas marginalis]|uniref:hypothetical protein n=1 Tax=Pseudomonas marginalis TaxID=298 RepID=UPI0039DF2D9A